MTKAPLQSEAVGLGDGFALLVSIAGNTAFEIAV